VCIKDPESHAGCSVATGRSKGRCCTKRAHIALQVGGCAEG
jgi:hypothetical protein